MKRNSSSNLRFVGGAVALLWGMGAIPGVAADEVCYTTIDGFWKCTKRLSLGVRIAICIGVSILLSALLALCLCLGTRNRRSRRQQEAIAAVYQVEASQIQGPPPTTYVTSFDPRSAAAYPLPNSAYAHSQSHSPNPPSAFPQTPAGYPHTPDADTLSANPHAQGNSRSPARSPHVRFQPTQERYQGKFSTKPPQTAPVNTGYGGPGAYPFPGYTSKSGSSQQPHTAYSTGFPRPLYTGQAVEKETDREARKDIV
ncbi:hypothetical protein D9615_008159 [Tricholomella constricta]|uniref:Uncharacterized protein n=1 Tax=Tricholomella constricta TaxID=117010 RepID=A0A8H5M060_9AGAR|nr:hypothetical protein D9615_008159 [Tricholomella constricta]